MIRHIMVDIETLSTASDAAIIQMGAQMFDPQAVDDAGVILGEGFIINVDPQSAINAGMRVDWSTVHWWVSQPEAFKTLPRPGDEAALFDALGQLTAYFNRAGTTKVKVWSNGAAFDIPILETAYRLCRRDPPWSYSNALDVRTMGWLCESVEKVKPVLAHNALSDCRAQALYVSKCWRALGVGTAKVGEDQPQSPAAAKARLKQVEALGKLWDKLCELDWHWNCVEVYADWRAARWRYLDLCKEAKQLGPEGENLMRNCEEWLMRNGPPVPRPGSEQKSS